MHNQILIIDDDYKISSLLQKLCNTNGFIAFYALTTEEARTFIKYIKFDLLVVDYMMPKENGIDFLINLKNANINIPSLMLTAVDEIDNKLNALSLASDDYMTKPFNSEELLLRIKNIIKRNAKNLTYSNSNIINIGDIVFNKITLSLKINNQIINLSSAEEEIFKIFVNNINMPLEKEDILKQLGKNINDINLNNLNVTIMRLRKKIEEDTNKPKYLKTIRGKGFILVSN